MGRGMDQDADRISSGRAARQPLLRATVALAVVLVVFGVDQASKQAARHFLSGKPPVSLLRGVLVLRYVENQGAFLGAGARLPVAVRRVALLAVPSLLVCAMAWASSEGCSPALPASWALG